jgi:trimeric autotransporter adhesin
MGSGAPYIATIAVSGSTVYVGGSFTTIGGQTRNNIAELDALTGMATPWDPNANTDVLVIKISGSIVYAGGHFSIIGGQTRRKIAALDASINSNNALPWNPNANDFIIDITISGNTIYVGGAFTTIGGQVRRKVAALDATINTNNALSWNPNAGNGWNVGALAVSGSSVLVGGNFTSINGEFRNNIAAIDLVSNTLLPWNPDANGNINTITIAGNTVYVGGDFTAIGGLPRNRIAALDLTVNTNNALAWNPNANNTIRTLAVSGNVVYAGGDFTHIGGLPRNRIAALDATMAANNVLPGWNPDANNIVRTLLVSGSIIYAGGDFTTMGVQNRNRIAAIDAAGTVTAWNPNANNIVRTLAEYGGTVYAGGDFLNIGGQLRARIAALDVAGNATAWSPNANNTVRALAIDGGILYAAGDFGFMGGETRRNKAAFDLVANTNSAISSWDPIPEGCFTLNCIDVSGYLGYIGGNFTAGGGGRSFFLSAIPSLSQILPVQLKEFKLTKESNNCIVQWTVTNATEKIKFELQRSSAGNDFISIAERETNNTSEEYRFTVNDNNLTPGIYYYRIKTIQESGETNYSDTRSLVISGAPVDVYPTRIHGDNLNIVLKEKNYSFQLINSAGILMMHQPLIQGINNIDTRKLPAGIYFYIIRNKNQQPEKSGKILVQ